MTACGQTNLVIQWLEQLPRRILPNYPRTLRWYAWALTLAGRADDAEALVIHLENTSLLLPQLPPNDLLTLGKYVHDGRHEPVEQMRARGHHDPDRFFGDDALRPDPVWMALRKMAPLRPLTAIATRIGHAFDDRAQRRDVVCIPER